MGVWNDVFIIETGYLKMDDIQPILLIVRADGRCATDVARCTAVGWRGAAYPLLRLVPFNEALAALSVQLTDAAAVFWVSPSAVQIAAKWVDWQADVAHIAVGQATAAALRDAGARQVCVAENGNDSTAAAQLSVWNRLPEGGKVCVVRGENGRDELMDILREQGLQVACCGVYRRVPQQPDWPLDEGVMPDAVWLTSAQLARLLFAQRLPEGANWDWADLAYLTHHPRIAAVLRDLGAKQVKVLAGADALPQALRERKRECTT